MRAGSVIDGVKAAVAALSTAERDFGDFELARLLGVPVETVWLWQAGHPQAGDAGKWLGRVEYYAGRCAFCHCILLPDAFRRLQRTRQAGGWAVRFPANWLPLCLHCFLEAQEKPKKDLRGALTDETGKEISTPI
jgi:hypothetical protein